MILKLRRKLIALSLAALLTLLTFIVIGINLLNYNSVVDEADEILSLLSQNQGAFPSYTGGHAGGIPHGMSPETPAESRFFSVVLSPENRVVYADTDKITAVDADTALEYAMEAYSRKTDRGFVEDFRYIRTEEPVGVRIIFLDWGRRLDMCRDFAKFSILMSLAGFALIAVAVWVVSGKFTRPVVESYEKQKRFITDAGHEIKTPLTIISANVDVLRMDAGDSECLDDISQQVKRLTTLTNDLVYLARMEEAGHNVPMIDFPVSDVVAETAASFRTPAKAQNKAYSYSIEPMLTMKGNDGAMAQLVSILMDNALKYSPEGGKIYLGLFKQSRRLVLTVKNDSAMPIQEDNLRHVFDRFYRADASRSSATGGHGIGLAMAQAITQAHGGKITASSPDGKTFVVTAEFPL